MVPVIPAAHYMCGGVMVDLYGKTSIENLYACGEVAYTGLHGANRLASNSLLEGLVFAEQAAISTLRRIKKNRFLEEYINPVKYRLTKLGEDNLHFEKEELQKIMWKNTGIIRNSEGLKKCIRYLSDLKRILKSSQEVNGINIASMELLNMAETSLLISVSALVREESRGCHYREDFPGRSTIAKDPKYSNTFHIKQKNSMLSMNKNR
jgi:L-aspartate oxidase